MDRLIGVIMASGLLLGFPVYIWVIWAAADIYVRVSGR
jgi:hypothetical protein